MTDQCDLCGEECCQDDLHYCPGCMKYICDDCWDFAYGRCGECVVAEKDWEASQ